MKSKPFFCICLLLLVGISLIAIIATTAVEIPSISIATENVFYQLNEEGVLTIQIPGKMVRVSQAECESTLTIAEEFPIETISDGSPIIELLNDGYPLTLTQDNEDFLLTFGMITYNTTHLPPSYTLDITSSKTSLKEVIIPKWSKPVSSAGKGATTDCYISSFWAYDTTKGSTAHVKTYIYNPNFLESDAWGLKFRTTSTDYDDWTDQWTPEYNGGNINPYSTLVVHSYLQQTFAAQSGKRYAFNAGDFRVTRVFAQGDTWGDPWSDYYDPSAIQGEFSVNKDAYNTRVFIAAIYDSEFDSFLDAYSKNIGNFISEIQDNPIDLHRRSDNTYWSYSGGMEEVQDLIFTYSSKESEWWDDEGNSSAVPSNQEVRDAGQTFLGSTNDWNYQGGWGTDDYNHGFDILLALTGEGACNGGGTLRGENWCRISFDSSSNWTYSILTSLHEFYHLYYILEGGGGVGHSDTPEGYVMHGGTYYGSGPLGHSYVNGWFRIDYTNNYLVWETYENKYDGFD